VARLCIRPWFHPDQIGRISLFILHKESCQWQHHAHNNMNTPTEWHRPAAYIPRAQPQHMQRIRQLLVSVGASAATCICHAWQKICKMSLGQTLLSFHLVGEAPCMPCVAHRTTNTHTHHQPKRSTGPVVDRACQQLCQTLHGNPACHRGCFKKFMCRRGHSVQYSSGKSLKRGYQCKKSAVQTPR
jgi:hypothetical protein